MLHGINNKRDKPTWCKFLQPLLYLGYKFPNMRWWSCPKYQTVPRIDESGLNAWVLKPLKDRINIKTLKIHGEKILFLFSIASSTMGRVPGLDLFLSSYVSYGPNFESRACKRRKLHIFLGLNEC